MSDKTQHTINVILGAVVIALGSAQGLHGVFSPHVMAVVVAFAGIGIAGIEAAQKYFVAGAVWDSMRILDTVVGVGVALGAVIQGVTTVMTPEQTGAVVAGFGTLVAILEFVQHALESPPAVAPVPPQP